MSSVAIVTDTTHCLPGELIERHELHQVSLYVNWEGRQDREADLPDYDGFYAHLRTAEQLPTTSQPSIGDFLEVFEPLLDAGRDIVSIHLSGDISGTCESARQARTTLIEQGRGGERIDVVDSRTVCAGEGFVVLAAAAAARAGAERAAVVARAHEAMAQTRIWFGVDTLEFLRRGGRIGGAQAWLGTALQIKPILSFDGVVVPLERVRTSGRVFERMVGFARELHEQGRDAWAVQHIQSPDRALELAARGREVMGCEPLLISEIGPVIGTHAGPGLLGVGGIPAALLA